MTTLNEGFHVGEFLLSEANGELSREQITVAQTGAAMVSGTVLGKVTASGKYKAYSNAASDGTEVAAAVLWNELSAATGDVKATVIARQAEVMASAMTGLDTPARADLAALGVIVR